MGAPQVKGLERVGLVLGQAAAATDQVVCIRVHVRTRCGVPLGVAYRLDARFGLAVAHHGLGLGLVPPDADVAAPIAAGRGVVDPERHQHRTQLVGSAGSAHGLGRKPAAGEDLLQAPARLPGVETEGSHSIDWLVVCVARAHEGGLAKRTDLTQEVGGEVDLGAAARTLEALNRRGHGSRWAWDRSGSLPRADSEQCTEPPAVPGEPLGSTPPTALRSAPARRFRGH